MGTASIRLFGTLNDFLKAPARDRPLEVSFQGTPAVKDVVEAIGVPHVEIARVTIDDRDAPLEQRLGDRAKVAVYPAFWPPESGGLGPLRPPLPPRFVLDGHLAALARNLRLLGIDALLPRDTDDRVLAELSGREGRILLSRDLGLLKRGNVRFGYWPRSTDPDLQLLEVARRFALAPLARPFTRCLRCGALLVPATKEEASGQVPQRVARTQNEFQRCPGCQRFYWAGTHHRAMALRVAGWLAQLPAGNAVPGSADDPARR